MEFEFCDAHLHLTHSLAAVAELPPSFLRATRFCACAHSEEEFLEQEKSCRRLVEESGALPSGNAMRIIQAFGLHPQMPLLSEARFLESLLREGRIRAVGEAGFDFFSDEFREKKAEQEEAWRAQLDLAKQYSAPLVIHARKAMQKIFEHTDELKKLRAVVFHAFAGSVMDARSILRRGVNAYFSFGTPLMNGAKRPRACVKCLPLDRLLLETDAPYQTLKNTLATSPLEIARVYQCAYELRNLGAFARGEKGVSFAGFSAAVKENFRAAFADD